jgi:DNA-binding HxlR family transcriptional regulator
LQTNGLVTRTDHGGVPRRVEYELTELGRTLMGPIRLLTEWAEENGEAILAAQEAP